MGSPVFDEPMRRARISMLGAGFTVPEGAGVRRIGRDDGVTFDVAGTRFTWKARGEDTGFALSMYEQNLSPGEGVPLHVHPYSEVFYVLEGQVDFLTRVEPEEWTACVAGETVVVAINSHHAFYNRVDVPARLLSVSTQLHQAFFDAIQAADADGRLSDMGLPAAMVEIGSIAAQFDMTFESSFRPPAAR